ncbi:hypothetical protein [Qipengyuania qiaonensis]|uniref:Uncharacterized protein n=1 Tax=Qipengyuania qiaonensis TaxID=2867240 RepID=A0ABS7JA57_9SPHN|nr:hypothetical protein [Qipengyuania qiaonensis]MBX7482850.1 hypothetical protein [Qipengyuania qiaonensis]
MHRIMISYAAFFLAVGCGETDSISAQPSTENPAESGGVAQRSYSPPPTIDAMVEWTRQGELSRRMNPDDPASPHFISAVTGPRYDVYDHDTAIGNVIELSEMDVVGSLDLEPLDAWREWDGRDMRIGFVETRFGGGEGVAFVLVNSLADSDQFDVYVIETTRHTFEEWGGAARTMQLRGLIPTMESIPEEHRRAIATASLDRQTALYEAALNEFYKQGLASLMAMTQAQALNRMRELNYDLLLGGDITSPLIGD